MNEHRVKFNYMFLKGIIPEHRGMKPQSCVLEMKELLETHLDQLNLPLRKWRPRSVEEHSLSSPIVVQTSAIWGGGGGIPFRGFWVRRHRLPTLENSLSYLTEHLNLENRNHVSAFHHGTQNMHPLPIYEKGGSCCYSSCASECPFPPT